MGLTKQKGNMYNWTTHVWNCVLGTCINECKYCYVKTSFWIKDLPHYKGETRFNEKDANINLGKNKTIFVCHTNDLFSASVEIIEQVLSICRKYPENTYVFQTKNPYRVEDYLDEIPKGSIIGTTIESDANGLVQQYSYACSVEERMKSLISIKLAGFKTFVTIEPILRFTDAFYNSLIWVNPDFVNIGADSKGNNLIEPSWEEVERLIQKLKTAGIEVREKSNLDRLKVVKN